MNKSRIVTIISILSLGLISTLWWKLGYLNQEHQDKKAQVTFLPTEGGKDESDNDQKTYKGGGVHVPPADRYLFQKPRIEMTAEELDKYISYIYPGRPETDASIRSYREMIEERKLMKNYLDHYPPLEKQAIMTGIEPPGFDAGLKWVAKPPPGLAEEFHQRLKSGEDIHRMEIKEYFSSFNYPVPFPLEKPWTDIKIRELLDGDFPTFFYVENGKSYLKWMGNPYLDRNQLENYYYRDGNFVHLFAGPAGQDLSDTLLKDRGRIFTLDTENDLYYEWTVSNEVFELNRKIFEENWTEE